MDLMRIQLVLKDLQEFPNLCLVIPQHYTLTTRVHGLSFYYTLYLTISYLKYMYTTDSVSEIFHIVAYMYILYYTYIYYSVHLYFYYSDITEILSKEALHPYIIQIHILD